jgi:hypothetical protein
MRRAPLPVDHAAGAESRPHAGAGHGSRERPAPQPVGGHDPVEHRQPLGFVHRPSLRLGIEIHHAPGQRQPLDGEVALRDDDRSSGDLGILARPQDGQPPRLRAGFGLHVEADQRRLPAGVREEMERPSHHGALDDRLGRHPGDVYPGDVADPRACGMPDDLERMGAGGHRRRDDEDGEDEDGETPGMPAAGHSGRCCRRNCSISSIRSAAGGRSPGSTRRSSSSPSMSFASSFFT